MEINTHRPWELPDNLQGIAIVSDVYAATSNLVTLLAKGVDPLYIASNDTIEPLKKVISNAVVIGENLNLPKGFFDISNLPCDIEDADLGDRPAILYTTNGTHAIEGIINRGAEIVVATSFTNISSVVDWIREENAEVLTLVPAGHVVHQKPESEDELCVQILREILTDTRANFDGVAEQLKVCIFSQYEGLDHLQRDFELISDINRYTIVPRCQKRENGFIQVTPAKERI